MMICFALYVYVMYNLSPNFSGTDINKAKQKVSEEGEGTEGASVLHLTL